jgi:hypothetical protein
MTMSTSIPVVKCRVTKPRHPDGIETWEFFCPYCHRRHVHGAAGGEGHRVAHCHVKDSPYRVTGYVLTLEKER